MAEPGGALFGEVTEKRIRRGSFKSEEEPERAIEGCQRLQNAKPKPFVWTKDADLIVRKVKKACDRLAPPVNQKRTSDSGR